MSGHPDQISSYPDPTLKRRMLRIAKAKPRLTLSKQVEMCLKAHLPTLEADAGLTPKKFTSTD